MEADRPADMLFLIDCMEALVNPTSATHLKRASLREGGKVYRLCFRNSTTEPVYIRTFVVVIKRKYTSEASFVLVSPAFNPPGFWG